MTCRTLCLNNVSTEPGYNQQLTEVPFISGQNPVMKGIVVVGFAVVAATAAAQEPESWFKFWGWFNSLNSGDLAKHEAFLTQQMSKGTQLQHSASEQAVKEIDILSQAGGGFTVYKTLQMSDTEMHVILKGRDGITLVDAVVRLTPYRPYSIATVKLHLNSDPPEVEKVSTLSSPELLSPASGEVFGHFPRRTTLRWHPVPVAASDRVQWDYKDDQGWASEVHKFLWASFESLETSYTFDFVGAQPGRWRVWAVDIEGNVGPMSEWRVFRYTQ